MKNNKDFKICILTGGIGPERDVSISTGNALAHAVNENFPVELIELNEESLPAGIDSDTTVVFPAIHGTFGEDGRLQSLLEEKGISYCGSDSVSSRLCMDKYAAKKAVERASVRVSPGLSFKDPKELNIFEVLSSLGQDLVVKPIDQGSSVALYVLNGERELRETLHKITPGNWMIEKRVFGREVTVGILNGCSLGIVEVIPKGGVYDFERKYSPGSTEYRFPAILDSDIESEVKTFALNSFHACGCRDFARVDFIICEDGNAHFLEINTLPGLTETSLLPKSASCAGYDFMKLAKELLKPAIDRHSRKSLVTL